MGWRSPETLAIYTKTINKRQALKAVIADEEAQELADEPLHLPASQKHRQKQSSPQPFPHQSQAEQQSLPDDHDTDELAWYEQ